MAVAILNIYLLLLFLLVRFKVVPFTPFGRLRRSSFWCS
ncbi:hypothetical protein ABIA85_003648 [Bradyrhizobium sp. LA6.10]